MEHTRSDDGASRHLPPSTRWSLYLEVNRCVHSTNLAPFRSVLITLYIVIPSFLSFLLSFFLSFFCFVCYGFEYFNSISLDQISQPVSFGLYFIYTFWLLIRSIIIETIWIIVIVSIIYIDDVICITN